MHSPLRPRLTLLGPHSPLAGGIALATFALDQGHKWWMLYVFRIQEKGSVSLSPYLDLVFAKNTGISYSLFNMGGEAWQLVLAAFALIASAALWIWSASPATSRLGAASLALIMGGALGNGLDRLHLGGVADFFQIHFVPGNPKFDWYIFNIADIAIVAGVIGLLYESLSASRKDAAKNG